MVTARRRAAAAALLGGVLGGLLLAGCGGTSDDGAGTDPTRAATSDTPTAASGTVPAQFLQLTAEHLCEVQGEVYPDPAALAEAFATAPDYPGIPEDRVRTLTRRLETDQGFARGLNDRIAQTCGDADSAG